MERKVADAPVKDCWHTRSQATQVGAGGSSLSAAGSHTEHGPKPPVG